MDSNTNTNITAPASSVPSVVTASRPQPPRGSDDFSFKDLIDLIGQGLLIIRAKWYWGVAAAAIVAGAAGYYLFTKPVEITAQTALLAQSTLDRVIGTGPEVGGSDQSRENNLRNHLSMMTSRKFRARLVASFTPDERAVIAAPYLKPDTTTGTVPTADDAFLQELLAGKIGVERERGREYYTISVSHRDAATAKLIADRVAAEYINHVQQEYREANQTGYELLAKQAEAIRADLARIEGERLDFRKANGIISRADNQGILTERLKRLDASLADNRVKLVGLETLARQARVDREASEYPWDNAYLAGFANNETLRQELDRQLAQRQVLASRYGPNHPKLRDIDSQIRGIQANIKRNFDIAVRDLEAQLDVSRRTQNLLQKEFDDAFNSSIEIEKLASTYEILSAGVESKKITLAQLEKKIGEASISSKLPADFMQIVDPAYLVKPRVPKPVLYGVFVAFLALGCFVVTPLVASTLDERISGRADLEKVLGLNLLGAIPVLKMRKEDRAHVVRNRVDVVTGEAFVGIAGQLEISSGFKYPKTILVTSTLPGEGKSLIVSNLASSYRQLEKKVVVLDLDLRRPVQHTLHGVKQERGFLTWARGGFNLNTLFDANSLLGIQTLADGTDLIPAGGSEEQPSNFLVAAAMKQLIEKLAGKYDVVILDTPPSGVFQDALVLGRYAGERLLVARENVAPTVQVKKTVDDFAKAKLPFQGVVLNGFVPGTANKKLAYSYKAATKGYSYTAKAAA